MRDTMETLVKIDDEGRIYLPKDIRETIKDRVFMVREEKGTLIFDPVDTAKEGRGIFKPKSPITNIDKKIAQYTKELVEDELH
jgi:bifunctional DNA-binding transcriptional regulator/antitoxin component of YhaV-PrlF toxin-antitoxin module